MKTYVQQIMLGTVTGSEEAARSTLQRIKAAGYDGLELNRFMIHPTSLLVRLMTRAAGMPTGKGGRLDWQALLREAGLGVASLQTDLGSLEREPEAVAREAQAFGTDKLVITGMYRFDYGSEDAVKGLADRLNAAGAKASRTGCSQTERNSTVPRCVRSSNLNGRSQATSPASGEKRQLRCSRALGSQYSARIVPLPRYSESGTGVKLRYQPPRSAQ